MRNLRVNKPKTKYKKKSLLDLIKLRLKQKLDLRIILTGEAGIGKSTLALKIGEMLDKDYINNPSRAVNVKVVFNGLNYLRAMKSEPHKSVLIMDESGQAIHHREFMNEVNVILGKTLMGNRYKRFVQIFCIPNLEMLDKDARGLAQLLIHVNKRGDAEVFRIISPKLEGKTWYKKLYDHYRFGKPNAKLWRIYERKKIKEQEALYDTFEKRLEAKDKPVLSYNELKNIALENQDACMKGVSWNVRRMQVALNISRDRAEVVKAMLDKSIE